MKSAWVKELELIEILVHLECLEQLFRRYKDELGLHNLYAKVCFLQEQTTPVVRNAVNRLHTDN